ncbi:MAG: hypothetical protein CO158_00800 [Piscirickettsiaceae bacterium CG_4_9_14_3_um_filter_43_564]|nr:hypothetical protein [Thiomicrospira sp.]OIP94705.1 MAG: hypothetical protein AUK56_07820 [Thiomicrospira sp. CG2_30_44_34]PIQ03221.1 MAG: hypothetical protein COW74_08100 [Piscirickettsiaceae bacterium CG18_big_fil_WC_8_21_14_2_50_44_103]PIU39496.1 MAG: hypothetical protein COT01_01380 [Piscirickettsiaceae bacterium CG07_land_8_20_14_0_80_44_28]PIW58583.1 MAG: hypothetical protein COW14_00800 [Piscirickettsiaceae bacterium CG12_big_fil_rev_8_21_14_0_65_44_934]PIW78442.1 MAG: hypothetical p
MFSLFKNSRLVYPLNWIVLLSSLFGVIYWLYFAFIEKAFLDRVLGGTALLVDLLLGLPVVLIFALVVYALIYWGLKVLVIVLLPNRLEQIEAPDAQLSDTLEDNDLPEALSALDEDKASPKSTTATPSKSDSNSNPDE